MRFTRYLIALLLALALNAEGGEPSRPVLVRSELPVEVLNDCAAMIADGAAVCADESLRIRWVGRTPRGQLFLVERAACEPDGCRAWLVTKDDLGLTEIVLVVNGEVRLEPGAQSFPAVRVRAEVTDSTTSYARFEWNGGRYVRTSTKLLYRVDGFECAPESECETAAREALRRRDLDRAVRIWQQVYGVGWI